MTDARADVGVLPGTRLDGRYRLHRIHLRAGDFAVWKASDDLLNRTVAVQVFDAAPGPPVDVFDAVRTASRVAHVGLPQVFDANQDADPPYFVREWIPGRDLAAVVADGPLEPHRAARDFLLVSETLATAHAAGLPHLRLTPRSLVWSSLGGVKVVGLGVEAAAAHARVDDPELVDTRALAGLLCVALSGRCRSGDIVVRPSWSRATRAWWVCNVGTGRDLIALARRTMSANTHRADAIRTPAQLEGELRRLSSASGVGYEASFPRLERADTVDQRVVEIQHHQRHHNPPTQARPRT